MTRLVLELRKGAELFMLIGQEGTSACVRKLGEQTVSSCQPDNTTDTGDGIRRILNMDIKNGGGGGGGGTYLFMHKGTTNLPIAVAGGGGGLGFGKYLDAAIQHGQAINLQREPTVGDMSGSRLVNITSKY